MTITVNASFNLLATSEAKLIAAAYDVVRSFYGAGALVMLIEVAYAQENIFVNDPNVPVSVNWAAHVNAHRLADGEIPMGSWVLVP